MCESEKMYDVLESISGSLELLAVFEALKIRHSKEEIVSLIEERKRLTDSRTNAIMTKKSDEEIVKATDKLDDFDHKYPLIEKYSIFVG